MRISLGKEVDDSLGGVFDVFVFGLACESNRKIVFLGPSSQDSFDLVHFLASYVDLVNNDVRWGLYAFPWGVPAEAKSIDLPMLEGRSFGLGVDWNGGFVWPVLASCSCCKGGASCRDGGGCGWCGVQRSMNIFKEKFAVVEIG